MRIIRDTLFLDPYDRGAAAAIGNFDGVHLGHQAVIDIARAEARRLGVPLGVMTFEPHPRQFFASKDRDIVQKGYRGTAMEVNYVARNQDQAMADLAAWAAV